MKSQLVNLKCDYHLTAYDTCKHLRMSSKPDNFVIYFPHSPLFYLFNFAEAKRTLESEFQGIIIQTLL